ncbi:MAG: YncE family protein, partial [Nitrospirae bacterium]|nr:YncE family protein [Nitrospirota bacterium]
MIKQFLFVAVLVVIMLFALNSWASPYLYVTNADDNTVSAIDTASNKVIATITVGNTPEYVAVNPAGTYVYVTNSSSNTVSVINATSNTVVTTITVGQYPEGIAIKKMPRFSLKKERLSHYPRRLPPSCQYFSVAKQQAFSVYPYSP